jgi:hypothetical protein
MGIINVTPDSFSDGGHLLDVNQAVEAGVQMVEAGADLLDVGGESTRPGAAPVPADDETERVVPVIEALAAKTDVPVSVDTTKASVARRALDGGAQIVNDVAAGRFDEELFPLVAERRAPIVLMHMRGEPRTMQKDPRYDDVVGEIVAFLDDRADAALAAHPAVAIREADRSLRLDAENPRTYYVKAAALARFDQAEAARQTLLRALSKEPDDFVTWTLLGDLAVRRGRAHFDEARRNYARASALNPVDRSLRDLARNPLRALSDENP